MGFNRKQWGAIIIAALFGLSFMGYIGISSSPDASPSTSTNIVEYNGLTFTQVEGYWITNLNGEDIYFLYPPTELETIDVPNNTVELLSYSKIYFVYDPNQQLVLSNIYSRAYSFFSYLGIQNQLACTQEENCPDIPIIDCEEDHALIFLEDEESFIQSNNYCLELHAEDLNTIQMQLERTLYTILGIME